MKARLALVSTGIRRDLLAPVKFFTEFDVIHFYRRAEYGDLTRDDVGANLIQYRSPRELERRLLDARPDVIQGVEPFSLALQPCLWACFRVARLSRARLVAVALENRPLEIKFNRVLAFGLRSALKVYFSRACLVIALSEGARRNARACGVDDGRITRLMWGAWGVDTEEFSPRRAAAAPGGGGESTILFAGRLIREKGIFVLLDAFAQIRARLPGARLRVVGDGPARNEFETRVRELKLSDAVRLSGWVRNRALPAELRAADVCVGPSLTTRKWEEQVGMAALQAMACGVPVVVSRSGALPEYVPDGVAGLLVPEGDSGALANALLKILTDATLRARIAHDARNYACAHYDARSNVRRAEQVLLERCFDQSART